MGESSVYMNVKFSAPSSDAGHVKKLREMILNNRENVFELFPLPAGSSVEDMIKWVENKAGELNVTLTQKTMEDPYWYPATVLLSHYRRVLEEVTLLIEQKIPLEGWSRERIERLLWGTGGEFKVESVTPVTENGEWTSFEVEGRCSGRLPDNFLTALSVLHPKVLVSAQGFAVKRRCPSYLATLAGYRLRELRDAGQHLLLSDLWYSHLRRLFAELHHLRQRVKSGEGHAEAARLAFVRAVNTNGTAPFITTPESATMALRRARWKREVTPSELMQQIPEKYPAESIPIEVLDEMLFMSFGKDHKTLVTEAATVAEEAAKKDKATADIRMEPVRPKAPGI